MITNDILQALISEKRRRINVSEADDTENQHVKILHSNIDSKVQEV